jgi:hypothetical protein
MEIINYPTPSFKCQESNSRALKKSQSRAKCHAELGSASKKIKELRDPETTHETSSGHGSEG